MRISPRASLIALGLVIFGASSVFLASARGILQDKYDTAVYLGAREASLAQVSVTRAVNFRPVGSITLQDNFFPIAKLPTKNSIAPKKPTTSVKPPVSTIPPSTQSTSTLTTPPVVASCATSSFNADFLCLLNSFRKENSRGTLSYSNSLSAAATAHSSWMQRVGTLNHVGENGSQFFERCDAHGLSCYAENIAMGFTSTQHLFDMWKNSPGHRANMLGNYSFIGLGTSGAYATTVFR